MRILSQSLKSRDGTLDVALFEEFEKGRAAPVAWIVTSLDRPGHEWRHDEEGRALLRYRQLREIRLDRARGRYAPVTTKENVR